MGRQLLQAHARARHTSEDQLSRRIGVCHRRPCCPGTCPSVRPGPISTARLAPAGRRGRSASRPRQTPTSPPRWPHRQPEKRSGTMWCQSRGQRTWTKQRVVAKRTPGQENRASRPCVPTVALRKSLRTSVALSGVTAWTMLPDDSVDHRHPTTVRAKATQIEGGSEATSHSAGCKQPIDAGFPPCSASASPGVKTS